MHVRNFESKCQIGDNTWRIRALSSREKYMQWTKGHSGAMPPAYRKFTFGNQEAEVAVASLIIIPNDFLAKHMLCPHSSKFCWVIGCDSQQGRTSARNTVRFQLPLEAMTTSWSRGASQASRPAGKEELPHWQDPCLWLTRETRVVAAQWGLKGVVRNLWDSLRCSWWIVKGQM